MQCQCHSLAGSGWHRDCASVLLPVALPVPLSLRLHWQWHWQCHSATGSEAQPQAATGSEAAGGPAGTGDALGSSLPQATARRAVCEFKEFYMMSESMAGYHCQRDDVSFSVTSS